MMVTFKSIVAVGIVNVQAVKLNADAGKDDLDNSLQSSVVVEKKQDEGSGSLSRLQADSDGVWHYDSSTSDKASTLNIDKNNFTHGDPPSAGTKIPTRTSEATQWRARDDGVMSVHSGYHVDPKKEEEKKQVVASYTKHRMLGKGGFGIVYEVSRIGDPTGTRFAMKELKEDKALRHFESAEQEAKILKSVEHDNVIKYFEAFLYQGTFYMVLSLANNGDLAVLIKKQNKLSLRLKKLVLLDALTQILAGLSFLHSKNIMHRDLKPANILLHEVQEGQSTIIQYKITDFGLAKVMKTSKDLTKAKCGTDLYMCKEALNQNEYSLDADVWSMGCVFYELCMLEKAMPDLATVFAHTEAPKIDKICNGENWKDLRFICKQMLNRNKDARPTSKQLLEEAEGLLSKEEKHQEELSKEVIPTTARIQMFVAAWFSNCGCNLLNFDDDISTDMSDSQSFDRSMHANSIDIEIVKDDLASPLLMSDDGQSEKNKTFSTRTKRGIGCILITIIAVVVAVIVISLSSGDSGSAPAPTIMPTSTPSSPPTPTVAPSIAPSVTPTTSQPIVSPTTASPTPTPPTAEPTNSPSASPTAQPTEQPTSAPTPPTQSPTPSPTASPCEFNVRVEPGGTVFECNEVIGSVAIGAVCGDELTEYLPNLELITGGSLIISALPRCDDTRTEISLPKLRNVDLNIFFASNIGSNKEANFPALTNIGGSLQFFEEEGFDTLNFPVLQEIGATFWVQRYDAAGELNVNFNFDSLEKVNQFTIESQVEGEANNFFGSEVSLPALQEVARFYVSELSATSINMPVLKVISETASNLGLRINDNENLSSISFPQLPQIRDDSCKIYNNPELVSFVPSWLEVKPVGICNDQP